MGVSVKRVVLRIKVLHVVAIKNRISPCCHQMFQRNRQKCCCCLAHHSVLNRHRSWNRMSRWKPSCPNWSHRCCYRSHPLHRQHRICQRNLHCQPHHCQSIDCRLIPLKSIDRSLSCFLADSQLLVADCCFLRWNKQPSCRKAIKLLS